MHVGFKIAIGAGIVGAGALLLAACGDDDKDATSYALDKFGKMDDDPKDNKWTQGETTQGYRHSRSQEVNTYRVGDYVFGTRQVLQWNTTESMRRVFDAAKGNDAVLSLQELSNFALKQSDADKNGTLNHDERRSFEGAYGVTSSRGATQIIHSEPFSRYSPQNNNNYPSNPGYPGGGGGGTSPGDDPVYRPPSGGGGGGGGGGGTSPGDDGGTRPPSGGGGGGYVPPSNGGGGGGYVPPSNGGGTSPGDDSTDNGNPSDGDF